MGYIKDEEVILYYGQNKKEQHRTRRIAYWDNENERLFEFISNNFELSAEKIALIYKQRWQIELLFKQLKQNFPLKYFLVDNENAIEIQIWAAMLANLLITLAKSKVKRSWAFSNMVSLIRNQLMNYVDIYRFLEDPEGILADHLGTPTSAYDEYGSLVLERELDCYGTLRKNIELDRINAMDASAKIKRMHLDAYTDDMRSKYLKNDPNVKLTNKHH